MAEPEFLNLPPAEAVRFFQAKGYHVGFGWQDTAAEEHLRSFTVTKAMRLDILQDIRSAVDEALTEGTTFAQFQNRLEPLLRAKGWWGRKTMSDPLTGEKRVVQLGSPRRLRIIFDTNLRMAYARGQWERIERRAGTHPYLRYVAQDARTRPHHMAWHGTVLRWDHPFWKTHFPPNGWNCRCTVQQLSAQDLEDFGYAISDNPPPGWDETRPWENRRTGQTLRVPRGIDPGFGHNVGRINTGQDTANRLIGKIDAADPDLARAAIGQPWKGAPFKRFVELAQDQGRAPRTIPGDWPVAIADKTILEATGGRSRTVRLSAATAGKQIRKHPELGPQDYALVQRILDEGDLFPSSQNINHVMAFLEIDGRLWCAVLKATQDGRETYLVSLHMAHLRNLKAARLRGLIKREL